MKIRKVVTNNVYFLKAPHSQNREKGPLPRNRTPISRSLDPLFSPLSLSAYNVDRLLTSLLRKIGGSLLHDLGWVVARITPMRTMEIVMLVFSPRVLCVREMFSRPITNCFTRGSNFLKHLETLIKIFFVPWNAS